MKKILFLLCMLVTAIAVYLYFSKTETETKKRAYPKTRAEIVVRQDTSTSVEHKNLLLPGIVVPEKIQKVVFEVGGKLENGETNFTAGMKFYKGQLLYQINNFEAYMKMQTAKSSLKEKLNTVSPQLQNEKIWQNYISSLEPVSLIGELPESNTAEEQALLNSIQVREEHLRIKNMESNMSNYFWIAPFDGMVLQQFVKSGTKIKAGEKIAEIGTGKSIVKTKVGNEFSGVATNQNINILDKQKKLIAKGKYLKSVPLGNASFEVYFATKSKKNLAFGEEVFVEITM